MKLTLAAKGALLAGLFLSMELVILGPLLWMLSEAEAQVSRETHAREVVASINALTWKIQEATFAVGMVARTHDPVMSKTFDEAVVAAQEDLQALSALMAADSGPTSKLVPAEKLSRQALELLKLAKEKADQSDLEEIENSPRTRIFMGLLKGKQRRLFDLLHDAAQTQQDFLATQHKSSRKLRDALRVWIFVGIVFNVGAVFLLALQFTKSIAQRLEVLVDNTVRITKRAPLQPQLSGQDEIANLDASLHSMSHALDEVARMKREFNQMIVHDIRTPLSSVRIALTLLAQGTYGALTDQARKTIVSAESASERVLRLINQLLEIERIEAGFIDLTCETVDLKAVIDRSVDSLMSLAQSNQIAIETPRNSLAVHGDVGRLEQVVANLLANAIKFSPKRAKIIVKLSQYVDSAEIAVIDEGKGIKEEDQKRIFDRFEQVEISDRKLKGGSGLGLSICKHIVEAHGGSIGVISELGAGSTFWIRLPLQQNLSSAQQESCGSATSRGNM